MRRLRDGLVATVVRAPLDELPTNTSAFSDFDWSGFFLSLAKTALNARLHRHKLACPTRFTQHTQHTQQS